MTPTIDCVFPCDQDDEDLAAEFEWLKNRSWEKGQAFRAAFPNPVRGVDSRECEESQDALAELMGFLAKHPEFELDEEE
jgi:hypothetical protein